MRPVALAADPPEGDQEYASEPVPPEAEMVAAPLFPPLQLTLVTELTEEVIAVGWVIETVSVVLHPIISVMVQV